MSKRWWRKSITMKVPSDLDCDDEKNKENSKISHGNV
jgi:hypothetical protein